MVDIGTLITSTPEIRGGRPCIAGTGTSVQYVSILYNRSRNVEELLAALAHLEPKLIFAALTYYFANRDAIEAQVDEDEREGLRLGEEDRLRKLAG